ncbi:MAG: UTP--glucose-1-phosphate uridylyltransferase [Deltaproteobacteria bacterium]|nr:UTP--glucose-1-phosphate uridylyltransferase [Deltaproteobacteria bacterium]
MSNDSSAELVLFVERMRAEGLPEPLIREFSRQYGLYREGATGKLPWADVAVPGPTDVIAYAEVDQAARRARGAELLDQLVCVKLNGGLGTTMKLDRAKSLIEVREGQSFLALVARQLVTLRARHGARLPLLLMNSFHTRADSLEVMAGFRQPDGLPLDFLQHKVPRIERVTGRPATFVDVDENWTPPGHGDVYLALYLSGLLERLAALGYRWAFVSNIDNLSATVDLGVLGLLEERGLDFAMEVTDKSPADVKGGTLVRYGGRQLMLLERSQVEVEHLADFEDLDRFPVFNTNNLWWRIDAMLQRLRGPGVCLPLIVNPKKVAGVEVVQLETAMGAGIGEFERAAGIRVPRARFAPVKATCDLLVLRSDACRLDEDGAVRPARARDAALGPPVVRLDDRYYQGLSDFDARFPHPLSLLRCTALTVEGDVTFGRDVRVEGAVTVRNLGGAPARIPDGALLRGDVEV